jgi:hypothetical protein
MPIAKPGNHRLGAYARIAIGILLFFLIDGTVFGGGLYNRWIAPVSGLGSMERSIDTIADIPDNRQSILVIGDSRIAEGFSAALATEEARRLGSSLIFANGSVSGTTPRVWYYLLRQIRNPGVRLAAVAIMIPSYHDNDEEVQADRTNDITFLHPLLSLRDIVDFPASFLSLSARQEAAEAILFKGLFYQNDVQDFLRNPAARIHEAAAWHAHGAEWIGSYPGRNTSLAGLTFDLESGKLSVAPGHASDRPEALAQYAADLRRYRGHPPDNVAAAAYRNEWIGRIAELCQRVGIRLIVFRIPRGPLDNLVDADEQPTGSLAELARAGKLELLPADAFDNLERPEFFFDDLHMNHAGRVAFSAELPRAILPHLLAAK